MFTYVYLHRDLLCVITKSTTIGNIVTILLIFIQKFNLDINCVYEVQMSKRGDVGR